MLVSQPLQLKIFKFTFVYFWTASFEFITHVLGCIGEGADIEVQDKSIPHTCRYLCLCFSVALADSAQEFTHLMQRKGIMQCFQGVDGRHHGAPFKSC